MGGVAEVIQRLAKAGHGVVLASELRAEGVSRSALRHAVQSGRLVELFGGAFSLPGITTDHARLLAALRVAGDDAALSHSSAAHLLRFQGFELKPFHLSLAGHRLKLPADFVVHRTRAFSSLVVDGLRVTNLPRTIIDCAASVRGSALEVMLDDAHHRFAGVDDRLRDELANTPITAVRGVAELIRLLEVRAGQASESPGELKLWRELRARSFPPYVLQHTISEPNGTPVMRVDVAWLDHRVCLHFDSYRWHARRVTFDRDAAQRSRLAALGWHNLVVTQATLDSGQTLNDLQHLLARQAPQRSFNL